MKTPPETVSKACSPLDTKIVGRGDRESYLQEKENLYEK